MTNSSQQNRSKKSKIDDTIRVVINCVVLQYFIIVISEYSYFKVKPDKKNMEGGLSAKLALEKNRSEILRKKRNFKPILISYYTVRGNKYTVSVIIMKYMCIIKISMS